MGLLSCTMLPALGQIKSEGVSEDHLWIIVAVAMMGGVYLILRPKRKRDPLSKPGKSMLSQERAVERQMQTLLVELTEMARQISAQLDTRAAKLEALIKEADERIATLRQLGGQAPQPGGMGAAIETPDPRHAEVYRLADAGQTATDIAQQLSRPQGEVELILALRGKA